MSFKVYALSVVVIAVAGIIVLAALHRAGGTRRWNITAVIFWVFVAAVTAIVPLLTSITIHSYGLMLALAVIVCTLLLARDARRSQIGSEIIMDLVFWVVIGGIIGARIFYILLNRPFFIDHPEEMIMIQNGGLAWQGGLVLGAITGALYVKAKGLFLPLMLDLVAPYLALGQSIGRVGCFLNGCCYGREVSWGVYFPVHHAHLHPTQLYLSGGLLVIFLLLKRYQRFSEIPGLIFASYLILESCLRFGVEFFRADHESFFLGLSIYQFVCFGILMFAVFFAYLMLIKQSKSDNA